MKRVVLTGGTSGIGLQTARRLVEAGHCLDILSRRTADEFAEVADFADQVGYRSVDVTDLAAAQSALRAIIEARGGIDVLVNNAGVMQFENAHESTLESIAAHVGTNLAAPIALSAVALESMVEAGAGLIVNVASVAGVKATPKLAAYSAGKAGLIQYTRSLAAEYARRGVRAVAVAPGAVATQLTNRVMFRMIEKNVPLGRLQTVDEVAAVIEWLLSDAASSITGVVLPIDGGMSL